MDGRAPIERRERSSGPRDLATILAGVSLIFGFGAATDAFDRLGTGLGGSPFLDEGLAFAALTIAGIAIVAVRRWRQAEEEQLRRVEAGSRFREIVERVPAVVYVWDGADAPGTAPAGYISPQIEALLGYTPDEWVRDPDAWARRVHADDLVRVLDAWDTAVTRGAAFSQEYRIRRADGTWAWIRDDAAPVRPGARGAPIYQGVLIDVSEQVEARRRVVAAEGRYRSLVEQLPVVVYTNAVDEVSTAQYLSPGYESLTGYTLEERLADPELWTKMLHPDDRAAVLAESDRTNRTGEPFDVEYRIVRADGRTAWLHDRAVLVDGPDGPTWQGVLYDISERKRAEVALRESERRERDAAERLRALDDMKNTFLAAVSHELRSPLTSILGLALTLERSPDLDASQREELFRRLGASATKLDRLLKDLLDIDRLQRGIVEPQYRRTDVAALARRVIEQLEVLRGRRLAVEATPVVMAVDPPKVERIVENLLTNAARHTADEVRIWVRVGPHDAGVLIVVEDDGPGVDADLQAAIFEPFRQGPRSPHAPGTGVGLSLVARFAELHGGRAWVEDRAGGGASFRVYLPAPGVERVGAGPAHPHGTASSRAAVAGGAALGATPT